MKITLCILVSGSMLIACNNSDKELRERLANSDSMAINYYKGDGTMDSVVTVRIITDKEKIGQMAGFIACPGVLWKYDCGYDGSLHFFKMNKVIQDIDFRINREGCMVFSFLQHGRFQATPLPGAAKELIISFRK